MELYPNISTLNGAVDRVTPYHPTYLCCVQKYLVLRKNKDIKGIIIDGTEYMISQ